MRVGQWPLVPLHRTPPSISRAWRQKHRSPEPDCPRRPSLQGTPETVSLGPDQSPQRSASSDPSAKSGGIIQRESNNQVRFHTSRVKSRHPKGSAECPLYPQKRTFVSAVVISACAMCGRLRVGKAFLHVLQAGRCSHVFGLFVRLT